MTPSVKAANTRLCGILCSCTIGSPFHSFALSSPAPLSPSTEVNHRPATTKRLIGAFRNRFHDCGQIRIDKEYA
jgi:hypothetical protein